MIENKRTGQAFKGQHEAIISKELWEKVQAKLKDNDNSSNHTRNRNNNLLTGKLFDANGTIFTNQANSKRKLPNDITILLRVCSYPRSKLISSPKMPLLRFLTAISMA